MQGTRWHCKLCRTIHQKVPPLPAFRYSASMRHCSCCQSLSGHTEYMVELVASLDSHQHVCQQHNPPLFKTILCLSVHRSLSYFLLVTQSLFCWNTTHCSTLTASALIPITLRMLSTSFATVCSQSNCSNNRQDKNQNLRPVLSIAFQFLNTNLYSLF